MTPIPIQVRLGDRLVLAAPDRLHLLDPVAEFVWEAYRAGQPGEGIAWELAEACAIPLERAGADVERCLRAWAEPPPAAHLTPFPPLPPPGLDDPPPPAAFHRDLRLPGRGLRLQADSRPLLEQAAPLLGHLRVKTPVEAAPAPRAVFTLVESDQGIALWQGGHRLHAGLEEADWPFRLLMAVADLCSLDQDWLTVLHAGGVHNGEMALVLPALGGQGKTTLTAALVGAGFGYLSDDVVAVDYQRLTALPLPLPLRIRPGSVPLLRDRFPELGSLPPLGREQVRLLPPPVHPCDDAEAGYPIRAIVFLERQPNGRSELHPLTPDKVLARLLEVESLLHRPLSPDHIERLVVWLAGMPAFVLHYDGLGAAVERLAELLPP